MKTGITIGAVKNNNFFSNSKRTSGSKPEIQNSKRYGINGTINTRFNNKIFPIGIGLITNAITVVIANARKIAFVTCKGSIGKVNKTRKNNIISK
jgi:hypothetical protein